jgi:putative Mn2+ efflux pump MntP
VKTQLQKVQKKTLFPWNLLIAFSLIIILGLELFKEKMKNEK